MAEKARSANIPSRAQKMIFAAGGLVWRYRRNTAELAVIHRSRYDDWCLPKGKPKPNESLEATALREVKEETGCGVKITSFAGAINYVVGKSPKVVLFWNMELVGDCSFKPSEEVAELLWLSRSQAIKLIDYPQERQLISQTKVRRKRQTNIRQKTT